MGPRPIAVLGRFVYPQPDHVIPSWVTWLYGNHCAHPSWQIWIGQYEGSKRTWYAARYVRMESKECRLGAVGDDTRRRQEVRRIEYGVQTTLVVGRLTVQIRGMDGGIRLPAPTPVQLQQIWPAIGYVEWPPKEPYDDATLESLADRFAHASRW